MKQIFLTVFMILFAVNISANTSCKVEGSSNNNVATLGESYYHSGTRVSGGNKCFVRTSVSLAKRSLGKTVVVIEIFDQYNQSVGNKMVAIDEGNQYSGEVRFEVNNSSDDGICGEYKFKIASATCEEKKEEKEGMKKPDAYIDLGLPSGTLWKNSNEVYCLYVEKVLNSRYGKSLRQYNPSYWEYSGSEKCYLEWTSSGIKVTGRELYESYYPEYVYEFMLPRGDRHGARVWDYFKPHEAAFTFDDELPTKAQWDELISVCKWEWEKNGAKVIGPNGNSIFLLAEGKVEPRTIKTKKYQDADENDPMAFDYSCKSYLIESTTNGYYCSAYDPNTKTWNQLFFNAHEVKWISTDLDDQLSVRLVKAPIADNTPKYVDLGLPSGTKWKNVDDGYDDGHNETVKHTPTTKQWEELQKYCTWTWMGSKYKVTGPNGKSIIFRGAMEKARFQACYQFAPASWDMLYYVKDGFHGPCQNGMCFAFLIDGGGEYAGGLTDIDGQPLRIRLVETPQKSK